MTKFILENPSWLLRMHGAQFNDLLALTGDQNGSAPDIARGAGKPSSASPLPRKKTPAAPVAATARFLDGGTARFNEPT